MFRRSLILAVAGFVGLTPLCAQAEPQVWQGQIGSMPIVMELDISETGNRVEGRYFYRKYKTDILLKGKKAENGNLHLTEGLQLWKESERVTITLEPRDGGWQGEWQGPKAKKALPVTLKPLDTVNESSSYNHVKHGELHLKAVRKQKFMGYTLEWMEESVTKLRMFRVLDGFSEETLVQINALLEKRQWREIDLYFECSMNLFRQNGKDSVLDFKQTVTPRFLNARLLSVSIFTNYYCGGAHPDFNDNPLNLDIENGKFLELEDLLELRADKPKLPRKTDDSQEYNENEEKSLASWLIETMAHLYPQKMASDDENGCNYTDTGIWEHVSWYLTSKGIYIGPRFPRIARHCEYPGWSILPWSIVNEHPGKLGVGKLP